MNYNNKEDRKYMICHFKMSKYHNNNYAAEHEASYRKKQPTVGFTGESCCSQCKCYNVKVQYL